MSAEQIKALIYLGNGLFCLAIAAACFLPAKKSMKAFLRLALMEDSTAGEDVEMMRRLVSFLVWSAAAIFLAVLAAGRLLDPAHWAGVVGF